MEEMKKMESYVKEMEQLKMHQENEMEIPPKLPKMNKEETGKQKVSNKVVEVEIEGVKKDKEVINEIQNHK